MYTTQKRKPLKTSIKTFLLILCFTIMCHAVCSLRMDVYAAKKSAIVLNTSNQKMVVGEELTLKASITKKIAKDCNIQWKSSKSSVASVNQKGFVKAKKKGTAKITAAVKGTSYKATCIIHVTDVFSQKKFTADLNGDGKSESIKVADIRTGKEAYVLLTAYSNGKTVSTKKYNGYYSSDCIIGDLSGNGADDILLLNYDTTSMHGELDIHALHFADGAWAEYPVSFIHNLSIAEKQPDDLYANPVDGRKNAWVGATILHKDNKNYLRCILLDTDDPEFDTVSCIDASYRQDGWYIENVRVIENYYSGKKDKDIRMI